MKDGIESKKVDVLLSVCGVGALLFPWQTLEFQVGRTSLLVGVLKTLTHNRGLPLPLQVGGERAYFSQFSEIFGFTYLYFM